MNLNLYACEGTWLMVDLGITFAGDTLPGIDVIMPDPAFIEERREDLLAIVLTHAHEDHLGAVAYLWPRLRCPVYATPFAAAVLREKLRDEGLLSEVPLTEVALSSRLELGPFALTFISLTHSIPEPNALLIETPLRARHAHRRLEDRPRPSGGRAPGRGFVARRRARPACSRWSAIPPTRQLRENPGSEADGARDAGVA